MAGMRFRKLRIALAYMLAIAAILEGMWLFRSYGHTHSLQGQHWGPMLVFAALAIFVIATWSRIRFSLRTLLIATTVVALVLGLVAWLTPKSPVTPPLDVGDFPADF
jgi:hypothetical protein